MRCDHRGFSGTGIMGLVDDRNLVPSSVGSGTEITGLVNDIESEILLPSDRGLKSRDWSMI
jgi:hypothetical protein